MTTRTRLRRQARQDGGFTLVELLVSMAILGIVFSVAIAATTTMYKAMRKQSAATDSIDQSRRIVSLLDKQLRYANAVTVEGQNTGTTASYVEWKSGITGTRQTCTQWRFTPASKLLEYRTWQPILNAGDTVTIGSWKRVSGSVLAPTSGTIFDTVSLASTDNGKAPAGLAGFTTGVAVPHEGLRVSFITANGTPKAKQSTDVTFTALNTVNSLAPPSGTCTEGGRP